MRSSLAPVVLLCSALLVGCSEGSSDVPVPSSGPSASVSASASDAASASAEPVGPALVQFREVRASGRSNPATTVLGEYREEFEALDCGANATLAEIRADEVQLSCDAQEVRYLLEPAALSTQVSSAQVDIDESGNPLLTIELDTEAAAELARITADLANTRTQLAIVVDGYVITAPTMASAISGGILQISGSFSEAEASDLVRRLTLEG